jgi:hypothetical protein
MTGISLARLLALFLSVSDLEFSHIFGANFAGLQQPLMVVVWWPLDARKGCGLGSDMIHGVCISTAFVTPFTHSGYLFSDATSAASANGLSMRHVRRFRYLPRACRQGMGRIIIIYRYLTDDSRSRSSPTISKHLCPRHLEQRTPRRRLKNSAGTRTCSSLPSATSAAGHWSSI